MYTTRNVIYLQQPVQKTNFNDFSVLGITEILMNIMSCHSFSKLITSTVILTFRSALAPYYLSKIFLLLKK